jgi:TatD DNase family protein
MDKPSAIDIHAHVNFAAYDKDREDVISRSSNAGVWMINVGTQKDTSESAVELANKYDGMYATAGMHPIHASGSTYHDKNELKKDEFETPELTLEFIQEFAKNEKVVAIGECGLDYYRLEKPAQGGLSSGREKQKESFLKQIHIANEVKKPLMLHVRGERDDDTPYNDALEILKSEAKVKGNFHFYAGSFEMAKKIWEYGFSTSFTGVITFARIYEKLIREVPIDMIMSETDCPYVAPQKYRGKRNEPLYVLEVVKKIADIRKMSLEDTQKALVDNAFKMFDL